MILERVIISNFKSLKNIDLMFKNDISILVGDNETGKSTLLEAINLVLYSQLNGRSMHICF